MGTRDYIETKQFIYVREFIVPLIKSLEIGDKLPEKLIPLTGGDSGILDLSLIKRNDILPLKLYFSKGKLINVQTTTLKENDPRSYSDLISGVGSEIYSNQEIKFEKLD